MHRSGATLFTDRRAQAASTHFRPDASYEVITGTLPSQSLGRYQSAVTPVAKRSSGFQNTGAAECDPGYSSCAWRAGFGVTETLKKHRTRFRAQHRDPSSSNEGSRPVHHHAPDPQQPRLVSAAIGVDWHRPEGGYQSAPTVWWKTLERVPSPRRQDKVPAPIKVQASLLQGYLLARHSSQVSGDGG